MKQANLGYYSAPELAKTLNVNVSTVKRWVDNGLLHADITPGGHRKINAKHLAHFIRSQPKLADGSYVIRRLARLRHTGQLDYCKYYAVLLHARASSQHSMLVESYVSGYPLIAIICDIILPVLVKVGEDWRSGALTISDEHRMTFILRAELSALELMIEPASKKQAKTAVLACVADEYHEIPLLLLSLLLKEAGWQSIILGINTPALEVARAAKEDKVKLVCLTKSYSNIDGLGYINTLLNYPLPSGIRVALGGAGWGKKDSEFPPRVKAYSSFLEFVKDIQ